MTRVTRAPRRNGRVGVRMVDWVVEEEMVVVVVVVALVSLGQGR